MNVSTITSAYASAVPASVDLSKPSVPMLPAAHAPAVGDRVLIPATPRCGASVRDQHGDYGYGTCVRVVGHDRTVVGCVAVSFDRYGLTADGSPDYTQDIYTVTAVQPVYVPPSESEVTTLRSRLADAERQARASAQTIEDIRLYVLERREAGEICDAGTLRFLRNFGMDAWEQDFTMRVTVEVSASDFLNGERAADYVRNRLERDADDSRMTITDVTIDDVYDSEGDTVDF